MSREPVLCLPHTAGHGLKGNKPSDLLSQTEQTVPSLGMAGSQGARGPPAGARPRNSGGGVSSIPCTSHGSQVTQTLPMEEPLLAPVPGQTANWGNWAPSQ